MGTCITHRMFRCLINVLVQARCSRSFERSGTVIILLEPVAICGRNAESCHLPLCFGWQSAQALCSGCRNQAA